MNTRLATSSRNVAIDAILAQANGGRLRIYSGTQPTDPNTAIGAQVLLADLALSATAAAASAGGGPASFNAITDDSSADATGTATWCTVTNAAGTTRYVDGDVGTSGANLNLNSTSIVAGARVQVSSLTFALPLQGA